MLINCTIPYNIFIRVLSIDIEIIKQVDFPFSFCKHRKFSYVPSIHSGILILPMLVFYQERWVCPQTTASIYFAYLHQFNLANSIKPTRYKKFAYFSYSSRHHHHNAHQHSLNLICFTIALVTITSHLHNCISTCIRSIVQIRTSFNRKSLPISSRLTMLTAALKRQRPNVVRCFVNG